MKKVRFQFLRFVNIVYYVISHDFRINDNHLTILTRHKKNFGKIAKSMDEENEVSTFPVEGSTSDMYFTNLMNFFVYIFNKSIYT
jgi:hypothetical protein